MALFVRCAGDTPSHVVMDTSLLDPLFSRNSPSEVRFQEEWGGTEMSFTVADRTARSPARSIRSTIATSRFKCKLKTMLIQASDGPGIRKRLAVVEAIEREAKTSPELAADQSFHSSSSIILPSAKSKAASRYTSSSSSNVRPSRPSPIQKQVDAPWLPGMG